ncbi:hypothetical protein RJT34_16805 [Clitoria ternatea]|uniref:Uncharacterized protein n=1 Tax=Clitoria ternatea TaxID=43366 RepID=A0AAN9J7S1_CLITE
MYPQKIESSGLNPLLKVGEGGDISNLNSSLSSKRLTLFLEYHSDLCAKSFLIHSWRGLLLGNQTKGVKTFYAVGCLGAYSALVYALGVTL